MKTAPDHELVDSERLEEVELLRCIHGRWKYRFVVDGSWFTANSKEDAVAIASKIYREFGGKLLTREEKSAAADAVEFEYMDVRYASWSDSEIEKEVSRLERQISRFQNAAKREFNGGGRRTGPAVAAESARDVATHKQKLQRYAKVRSEKAASDTAFRCLARLPPFSHRIHPHPIVAEIRFLFATLGAPGRDRGERERARSARKRDVRASTINIRRVPKYEIERRRAEEPDDGLRRLPLSRDECRDGHRPCPLVSCRSHLFLDVDEHSGSIKLNFPDLMDDDGTPRLEEMLETCAMDVMDRGGVTLEVLGEIMNLTRERVRQLELDLIEKFEPVKR